MTRMLLSGSICCHLLLLTVTPSGAGPNASATLPLHVFATSSGPCLIDDPCDPGPPTIEVAVGSPIVVYLLARHYTDLTAGCLTHVDSNFPEGTHFVGGNGEIDPPQLQAQTGTICAGYPGEDRCDMGPMARAVCCRDLGGCDELWWRCDDGHVLWQQTCEHCVWKGACCHLHGGCDYMDAAACDYAAGDFYPGRTCEEIDCVDAVEPSTWGRIKALHGR